MRSREGHGFAATSRFEVLRCIGSGGMGTVYEALDRERNTHVALKTLHAMTGESLLRFKKEFRDFQNLSHPNLVSVGELFSDGEDWFFSMELIDGVSFTQFVRPTTPGMPSDPEHVTIDISDGLPTDAPSDSLSSFHPPNGFLLFDEGRLRAAAAQLAEGLIALHAANKVHCDLKPSNVLVTNEGRVVLLDFGLAADIDGREHKERVEVVGTIHYMAPEQAAGRQPGPPADWYAMGVVLFEALTGTPPFTGAAMEVLMSKQHRKPPSPRSVNPAVPEDLDALCTELLRFNPSERPTGAQFLRRLGVRNDRRASSVSVSMGSASASSLFVGRERELHELRTSFEQSRKGVQLVALHGESGVGKSALARRFIQFVTQHDPSVVVLRGTCYERESVPYKAVDGVIDSLSLYLQRLPKADSAAVLPRKAALLAQVFPVLKRVEAIAEAPSSSEEPLEPREQRSRLFEALRELFQRLADRRPVVVAIDDMQWADADSIALLSEVLREPDSPRLLLVATVRVSGTTDALLPMLGGMRLLQVERLSPAEGRELALALIGQAGAPAGVKAHQVAQEAGGHPLFIHELIRHAATTGTSSEKRLQLEEVLWSRISHLDPCALQVLQLVCLSDGKLAYQTAARAAGLDLGVFSQQVALLRVAHLVRTTGVRATDTIAPYHSRVRAAVLAQLPQDRSALHRRLAIAFEMSGLPDSEALATHWHEAGDRTKAAHFALAAAEKAERVLAFDRAVRFYERCLEALPDTDPRARSVRVKLADALSNAGRSGEAGDAYLRAAIGAFGPEKLELHRRAAEQLLISGRIDVGLSTLREVLSSARMNLAETPRRALTRLLWSRAQLQLRGLRFKERDASAIPAEELMRIDMCWSTGIALALVDTLRGADFQARNLLLSLRAGEPYRISRALAMELGYGGIAGSKAAGRTAQLQRKATAIADRVGHPHAVGLVQLMSGIATFLGGMWQASCVHCAEAETIFRDRCTGVTWELDTAQLYPLWARIFLGELGDLGRRASRLLNEARARGDLYLETNLRTRVLNMSLLAQDQPELARREVEDGIAGWSQRGFHLQNYFALHSRVEIALYEGEGVQAHQMIEDAWPLLRDSDFFVVQLMRIETLALRARCALMAAAQDKARAPALWSAARGFASRLLKEKSSWATAFAYLIKGTAEGKGQVTGANRSLLLQARDEFKKSRMALHAAAIGVRLGNTEQSAEVMQSQGVRNPQRMTDLLAPGLATLV